MTIVPTGTLVITCAVKNSCGNRWNAVSVTRSSVWVVGTESYGIIEVTAVPSIVLVVGIIVGVCERMADDVVV